ncbi:zinc-ribbon domain-containing protein [Holdemanella porci]|uniref:zinc-ribbon domain-containing protein n=1 Tax=Holdemanella porci TaxID=2652276 RepID=UPI0022E6F5C1|nr:zinc-ribbon domain-containing protein [Holdemanella porci]
MSEKRNFAEEYPELLEKWDFQRNTRDPYKLGPHSNIKVWWTCENGHHFERSIRSMTSGYTTCPECKKQSLAVISSPNLMKFWDYDKNTLDPKTTSSNSNEEVWFKCPNCGYNWKARICVRKDRDKCPVCETNMIICEGINDFRTVYPQLALDTSDEMNPNIDLNTLGIGSHVRLHWKCHICGFEWDAPVYCRVHGSKDNYRITSCPACAKNQRKDGYNVDYPELIPLYSPNNPVPLKDVRGRSAKLLWVCPTHGEFESTLNSMIRAVQTQNNGCPYCHGNKVHPDESFGVLHPELVKEWDESNEKTPYDYTEHSSYEAIWCCPDCGTKWEADLHVRALGYRKCPKCYGSQTFKERYPELEQYYAKDNDLPFEKAVISDTTPRNWICEHGHEFEDSFYKIHKRGYRCPYCESVKALQGFNDFAHFHPDLAQDYDVEKNGNKASEVTVSNRLVYFKCKEGHSFKRSIIQHIQLNGKCPVCNRRLLQKGVNDLATIYPEIVLFWDYEKNEKRPDEVFATLPNKYFFICSNGHHFECTLKELVENNFHCPVCEGKRVDPEKTSLQALNPKLALEFSANNDFTADQIPLDTSKNVLWTCPTCGDDYLFPVNERSIGDNSCPYCNHKKLKSGNNDLTITNPQLASEYSSKNKKQVNEVGEWQKYEVFWICPDCGAEYRYVISERSVGDDSCPVCANKRIEKGINDLATTNPEIAALLSPNNERKADTLLPSFKLKVAWICPTCNGEYYAPVEDMVNGLAECPYCNNQKPLAGFNTLKALYPEIAGCLSPNNDFTADEILPISIRNAKWICPTCGGEYSASVEDMVNGLVECPYCSNQKPLAGFNTLEALYPEVAEHLSPSNDFTADEILPTRYGSIKWICPTCGGEYLASVKDMIEGVAECPYCNNQRPLAGFNTLKALYPEIAEHLSPNNDFTADEILPTRYKSVKWICPTCGGEYLASVKDMIEGVAECPYCNDQRPLAGFNTLEALYPEIAEEMSPDNEKGPNDVLPTSAYFAEWTCPTCGYTYKASVRDRVASDDLCPACAGKKAQAGFNSLLDIYPEVQDEWAENENTLLGIFPDEILPTSTARVWWECKDCGRKYLLSVNMWVEKHIRGMTSCTYCSGLRMRETHILL